MKTNRKPALAFIFLVLVLDILGIGLIVPILPLLVVQLQGGNESAGALSYGWLLGVYALMQFVFAPILGGLSDQFGRRKVILLSVLGAGLDYFLMAWAPTLLWFFVGRILAGITGANFSAASAYIADISPPEKRAANFALIGAAFGLGFAVGPALGGWVYAWGTDWLGQEKALRLPFIVSGGLMLVSCLYGMLVLPESLQPENRKTFSLARANPFSALINLRRYSLVVGIAIAYLILNLGHQSYPALWALFSKNKFDWSVFEISMSLALVGVMAVIVQGGLARKLIPYLGEKRSVILGTVIEALSLAGFGLATREWMIYALIVVGSLGGIAMPALQGIASRQVPDNEQGILMGSFTSLQSVASFLGPIVMTVIFSYSISDQRAKAMPGAGFLFAALLTAVGLAVICRSFYRDRSAA